MRVPAFFPWQFMSKVTIALSTCNNTDDICDRNKMFTFLIEINAFGTFIQF